MMAEFLKALSARKHPGISARAGLLTLVRQAAPFVTRPSGRARPPLTIYWSINSVCDLRCKMCDVGQREKGSTFYRNLRIDGRRHEIPLELFKRVIDEVSPHRPMIAITSTEPLLYRDLNEAIAHVRRRGMEMTITTGGYTLPDRAAGLAEAGLTRLNVSIDGPPAVHNDIRGRRDSFERSAEGIRRFKAAAAARNRTAEVLVNCTISNLNYGSLDRLIDAIDSLPVDRINFSYMCFVDEAMATAHNARWGQRYPATVNCLNAQTDPGRVEVDVLDQQLRRLEQRRDPRIALLPRFSRAALGRYFRDPTTFMGRQRCMVNWFIAEIIATGEVIPYTRCYYVPFGNIHDRPFLDIWNGPAMRDWRRTLRRHRRFPACTRCDQCY